jgi:hypothetical protein
MFEVIIVLIICSLALLLFWWKSIRKKFRTEPSRTYTCAICNQRDCDCLRDFKKTIQHPET